MRQHGQLNFVRTIQSVEATNFPCVNTAKCCDTCVSIGSVISVSWAVQVTAKVRSVSVHSFSRRTLLASLPLSIFLSRHGPFIVRNAQLFHSPNGKDILRRSVGSMVEAETGFVPTSAQIIAVSGLLFTEISTLNSFLCPKVQCITV